LKKERAQSAPAKKGKSRKGIKKEKIFDIFHFYKFLKLSIYS